MSGTFLRPAYAGRKNNAIRRRAVRKSARIAGARPSFRRAENPRGFQPSASSARKNVIALPYTLYFELPS